MINQVKKKSKIVAQNSEATYAQKTEERRGNNTARKVENKIQPKEETYIYVGMTSMQRELYKEIITQNYELVNKINKNQAKNIV